MNRAMFILPVAAACLLTAGGCLVVGGSSYYESGVRVSQSTLNQVQVDKTTEAWLIAALGEPSHRRKVAGQDHVVEILSYEYTVEKSSGGAVFLVFAGGEEHRYRRVTYFEVTDGVVTRAWSEGEPWP